MAVKLQEQEKYYGIFKKQPEVYGNETIYTAQVSFYRCPRNLDAGSDVK
jgi:hypothetical protein